MNINRDYLIINDVKKSNVKLDNGSMFFYITDKNTQNIFVNLVINVSKNDLIQKYANIENTEDYTLTMNIVKPDNTYKIIEGKLHDKEKAIFEFNLNEDCCDEIGTYRCELLTKCNIDDHEEITTSNKLTYKVKSSVLNDLDDIVEAPEYPLVIQLFDKLSDIEQYEEDRRANELARQLAEEQRQARFDALDSDMVDRITAMDDKMVDVENRVSTKEQAVDKLIADTKADIDNYKTAKDQEIDEYKTAKDTEINNAITAQDNKIDEAISNQNDRITAVENNVVSQNNRLDIIENKNQQQDNRLDVIEAKNVEQDNRLDDIEAINVAQNTRLDAIEVKNQQQDDRLLDIEKVNNRQDIDIKCLYGASQTIDVAKEGNSIYLQNSNNGFTIVDEIKGNTLVNCNKEPDKELILNGNINTSGDNAVTITEGVDGGLVDVALEGNTLVNVSKTKDSTAITKAYTVENSGNHIALQGDIDGSCRPVVTGNTLVNIISPNNVYLYNPGFITREHNKFTIDLTNKAGSWAATIFYSTLFKPSTIYTLIVNIIENTLSKEFVLIDASQDNRIPTVSKYLGLNQTGLMKIKFESKPSIKPSNDVVMQIQNDATGKICYEVIGVLEGDYSDKPIPDYFTGLQSTFEDNLVTQEMVDSGEEVEGNLGKYRVDYKSTREDGTVGSTKTLYLNSPLLEGDTIEEKDGGIYPVHRSEKVVFDGSDDEGWEKCSDTAWETDTHIAFRIVIPSMIINNFSSPSVAILDKFKTITANPTNYGDSDEFSSTDARYLNIKILKSKLSTQNVAGFRQWLQQNPVTVVYKLATPTYELIEQSNLAIPSYASGHLDFNTAVPVEKVGFLPFSEKLTYLYPATSYTVQFISDKAISIDITLGGTQLLAQSIVAGLNRISITTPEALVDNKLIIDGVGAKISEVVVTDTDREFKYFEGMKSVGEGEDNVIKIVSNGVNILDKNLFKRRVENNGEVFYVIEGEIKGSFLERNIDYYFRRDDNANIRCLIYYYDENMNGVQSNYFYASKINYKLTNRPLNAKYFKIIVRPLNTNPEYYTVVDDYFNNDYDIRISTDTWHDYKPYQEPNKQQLTHEPLRAVGDVKDRYVLIDGKWYIERRCKEVVLDGSNHTIYPTYTRVNTKKRWAIFNDYSIKDVSSPNQISTINNKYCDISAGNSWNASKEGISQNNSEHYIHLYLERYSDGSDASKQSLISELQENPMSIVYQLASPTYEPIDYNPLEVYSGTTHITTNSTIPTSITVKNHGFNCLLKPSTTYTISSNLGLNTVTTPSTLTEDCLRFMDTDTSDVTTMKDVLVLEGDWTSKADLIPANFSGIKSAFEQEYNAEKGKYKVNIKVANEDKSKENNITFYINEPLRGVGDAKDRVFIKDDKIVVQRNCGIRAYEDGDFGTYLTDKVNTVYQLPEPTYEEVEYFDSKLYMEIFNNSTLFYNSNVPVTSKVHYSYSIPLIDKVSQTANISDEQDQLIIDMAVQVSVLEIMTL